jgi:hypothetical protein
LRPVDTYVLGRYTCIGGNKVGFFTTYVCYVVQKQV